ncbi:MAG TPA: DUF6670 family protein [Solimonas sp.]|nr:DUF6670 family protein [Solimonas sp.]
MTHTIQGRELPDSGQPPRGLADRAADVAIRGLRRLLGEVPPGPPPPLPPQPRFAPHHDSQWFGSSHYGIMIPDLPAPHRFLTCAAVLGMPGLKIADVDHAVGADGPRHTAVLVHGTAAATGGAASAWSMKREMQLAPDGSHIGFGQALEFSGAYPDFRLRSRRAGFEVDLELTATGEHTWFALGPAYRHVSLLTRYRGQVVHEGQVQAVSGLCTWEHFRAISAHLGHNRLLPRALKLPCDFFTYQVINLDADTQLLLTHVEAFGRPLVTALYERRAGHGSRRLAGRLRFQVLAAQADAAMAPDGRPMTLPQRFRWVLEGPERRLDLEAEVDTPMLWGLAAGYVGGYRWAGTRDGRPTGGRGYIEYIDQRD